MPLIDFKLQPYTHKLIIIEHFDYNFAVMNEDFITKILLDFVLLRRNF